MKNYQPVIGLEIHIELKTKSKMFCRCPADHFGKKPNTQTCPVCLGLPGALPDPNKKAIEWTIMIGKALNCQISKVSKFDRKHYFYPDLPKGYQISQYDEPIATNGQIKIINSKSEIQNKLKTQNSKLKTDNNGEMKQWENQYETFSIRINRVHLEEDTGKLIHSGDETLVDFNRSGVPLVEIVTEPDFDNSDDVKRFLEELQVIIRYLGVSDADMEKGSMRLETNVSVIEYETSKMEHKKLPDYKVEIKNINSFRFVKQAIDYEINRQIEILKKGGKLIQETRGFDEEKQITYSQRTKEYAHDYRYFPEPDIPPLFFSKEYIDSIPIPELPDKKLERYVKEFKIRYQDAFILTRDKKIADYFEEVNSKFKIQNSKLPLKIENYSQAIVNLIINKKLSINLSPDEFVKNAVELLIPKQVDEKLLRVTIERVIQINKKAVEDYKKGKENALQFLVGQVMREMKGKTEAKVVVERLKSKLNQK